LAENRGLKLKLIEGTLSREKMLRGPKFNGNCGNQFIKKVEIDQNI
jgi:hypothetical protein